MSENVQRIKWHNNSKVLHFETDDTSVQILDENKNLIGTLNELAFHGKLIENVDYRSIKHTGVYNVKNLKGVPSNIPADKRAILSITSVGNSENPDVIFYRIIGANGVITENTISGDNESGWGTGGISLQNTISNINNSIGQINELKTNSRDISRAINEVYEKTNENNSELWKLNDRFNSHNHDDRYVLKSGDTLEGNVTIKSGSSYKVMNNEGKQYNFARLDGKDHMVVGDQSYQISIQSKDGLMVNGHKVFTTENSGEGSGINADKLDGVDSSQFARRDQINEMHGDLNMKDGRQISLYTRDKAENGSDDAVINFRRGSDGKRLTYIRNYDGGMIFGIGDREILGFHDWSIWSNNEITLNAPNNSENRLKFAYNGGSAGFYYSNTGRQELGIYDWGRGKWAATFIRGGNPSFETPEAPQFQGRKLYLQNEQPGGNIPYGSVWIGF